MSFSKWIGAALGWSFGGPIGAIIGMALGSLIDGGTDLNRQPKLGKRGQRYEPKHQHPYKEQRQRTQSGDFEVSLLILASIVIKADGKQDSQRT